MKRLFSVLLALSLLLSLSACGLFVAEPAPSAPPSVSVEDSTEPSASAPESTEDSTGESSSEEESSEESTEEAEPYALQNSFIKVYRSQSGAVWAMAVAEVKNTGETSLYLDYADLSLLNVDGETVADIKTVASYPQVIAPGETAYYCDVVSLDVTQELELTLEVLAEIVPVDYAPCHYEVRDAVLSDSLYGGIELQATVENTSATDGELVCVIAILKDEEDQFLGFITGYLDSVLASGEAQDIHFESFMLPVDLTSAEVAEAEVYAYPLLDQP